MSEGRRMNVRIVWGVALAMLALFTYGFLKQTISSRNAGTLLVLLVAWFGWLMLTWGIKRGAFDGDDLGAGKRRLKGEPEVVKRGPDGAWVKAREETDDEEREELRRLDLAEALIDRHRVSIGAGENDDAWLKERERLVVAYEGQRVEDFRTQMIGRLGTDAFGYLVDVRSADNGLGAAEAVSRKFGDGFAVTAVYEAPMRHVIYEVRARVMPPEA